MVVEKATPKARNSLPPVASPVTSADPTAYKPATRQIPTFRMDAKFSPKVRDVISCSREEALRLGHSYIGIEHILLGIIRQGEGNALKILKHLDVDIDDLRHYVEGQMEPASAMRPTDKEKITLVKQAEKMLKITFLEAKLFKSPQIDTEHLLLSMLKDKDNLATRTLNKLNVDYERVKHEVESMVADGSAKPSPKSQGPSGGTRRRRRRRGRQHLRRRPAQAGRCQEQDPGAGQLRPRPDQTRPRTASWTPSSAAKRRSSA